MSDGRLTFCATSQPVYWPPSGDALRFSTLPHGANLVFGFVSGDYVPPAGDSILFGCQPPPGDKLYAEAHGVIDLAGTATLRGFLQGTAHGQLQVLGTAAAIVAHRAQAHGQISLAGIADGKLAHLGRAHGTLPLTGGAYYAPTWYTPRPFVGGRGGIGLGWSPQERLEPRVNSGWIDTPKLERAIASPWDVLRILAPVVGSSWRHIPKLEDRVVAPWADLVRALMPQIEQPYAYPEEKNRERVSLPWGDQISAHDDEHSLGYAYPEVKDDALSLPWDSLDDLDRRAILPYSYPAVKDREIPIISGPYWYPRWCIWQYLAPRGDELIFRFLSSDLYEIAGDSLVFNAGQEAGREHICYDGTWNGPKDAYWYRPAPPAPPPDIRSYYIIMNTISLKRVSDNIPIPIQTLEIGTDHDSWAWTLQATLRRSVDLDLVRPSAGAPVAVEASINGHVWQFIIEEYGDERRFGQRAFSISGRSLSAALAAPYSRPQSSLQTSQRTATQLADEALTGTGFTLDWQLPDWLVPGGAYSVTQQTPIQQLATIAEAAGGVVHSAMAAQTVRLLPWYPSMPWEWGAVTVDAVLPTWQERRTAYQPQPQYSGVYTSGQHQGVTCFVRRAGSDGAEQPQMQTHPLTTATEAGLALGKKILADSGRRSIESITAPLLENPGLLEPGKLIEVVDPAGNWRGLVVSTRLSAQRPTVTQQIDVLRYHGS